MIPSRISHKGLSILYAMSRIQQNATYEGLQAALGYSTTRGAIKAVREAESEGLVYVSQSGVGRGKKAIVHLTEAGKDVLRKVGIKDV